MSRKIILSIVGVLAAVFYLSSVAIAAGPNTDPRCAVFTGAAFGLCQAATAVGCDDPATQHPGCASIADNFTQMTGENPPWLSLCPCSEKYWEYASWFNGPAHDTHSNCTVSEHEVDVLVFDTGTEDPGWPWGPPIRYYVDGAHFRCLGDEGYYGYSIEIGNLEAAQVLACMSEVIGIANKFFGLCGM